jgi:transcriptional regulator with XRE-family HTH domain
MEIISVPPSQGSGLARLMHELREEREWTQAELGEKLGITPTGITRRENGETRIRRSELMRLAELFGTTTETLEARARSYESMRPPQSRGDRIPVLNRAPAGQVYPYEECFRDSSEGWEYLERGDLVGEGLFAVVVTGDSMEPRVHDGDYLVFRWIRPDGEQPWPGDGAVVFVRFDATSAHHGCTIARWHDAGEGVVVLTKDNPKYRPILANRLELEQLATFVEVRSKRI